MLALFMILTIFRIFTCFFRSLLTSVSLHKYALSNMKTAGKYEKHSQNIDNIWNVEADCEQNDNVKLI